jgi:hypothetical protein
LCWQLAVILFVAANATKLFHSFLLEKNCTSYNQFLSGYTLTLGIDLPVGSFEDTLMYYHHASALKNDVNTGFRFFRSDVLKNITTFILCIQIIYKTIGSTSR